MFLYDGKIFVFGGYNHRGVNANETCEERRLSHSSKSHLNQFFCFEIDSRTWRRCQQFGASRIGLHKYGVVCASIEVIGSSAILFGGHWKKHDNTAKEWHSVYKDSAWFVLDLELTLKGFCVQELLKKKDLDVSKLPPGLRRNFIQQGLPSTQ